MLLDKIQHYFKLVFIICLVITQAMVFVATKAYNSSDYELSAVFVDPIVGYSIQAGEQIDIQAMLSTSDNNNFSAVYFTVQSYDGAISLNFDSEDQLDGTWLAQAAWDTTSWPVGVYTLSATANIYDTDGALAETYISMPQMVNLVATAEEIVMMDEAIEIAVADEVTIAGGLYFTSPNSFEVFPPGEVFDNPQTIDFVLETQETLDIDASQSFLSIRDTGTFEEVLRIASGYNGGSAYGNGDVDVSELPGGEYTAIFESAILQYPSGSGSGAGVVGEPTSMPIAVQVSFTIHRGVTPPPLLLGIIISPERGEEASGIIDLIVNLRTNLLVQYSEVNVDIYHDGDHLVVIPLESSSNGDQYYGTLDLDYYQNNDVRLFNYEETYHVQFRATSEVHDFPDLILGASNFVVAADPNQAPEDPTITLNSPESPGTIYGPTSLVLDFSTNFDAPSFTYEFTNSSDHAITTGVLDIDYVDGYSWTATIDIDDTFVGGSYSLTASAGLPEDIEGDFIQRPFAFLVQANGIVVDPDDVVLELFVPAGSLSGSVNLVAEANFSGLNVVFVLEDTISGEVYTYSAAEVSQQYAVNIDTTQFTDRNYRVYAKAIIGDVDVVSDTITTTIFNGGDGEWQINSTEQYIDSYGALVLNATPNFLPSDIANFMVIIEDINNGVDVATLTGIYSESDNYYNAAWHMENASDGDYKILVKIILLDGGEVILSNIFSNVRVDNDEIIVPDVTFELGQAHITESSEGRFIDFPLLTSLSNIRIQGRAINSEGEHHPIDPSIKASNWQTMEGLGVSQSDYSDVYVPKIYFIVLEDTQGNVQLEDGDYYLYIINVGTVPDSPYQGLESNKVYFSLQNGALVDPQPTAGNIIIRMHNVPEMLSDETTSIFVSSNFYIQQGLQLILEDQSSGELYSFPFQAVDVFPEEELEALTPQIREIENNNLDTPHIFVSYNLNRIRTDSSLTIPNGEYFIFARYIDPGVNSFRVDSNRLEIAILNGVGNQGGEDGQGGDGGQGGSDYSGETISENAEVIIGIYTSCLDVGITNQATCQEFRAMVDLLDDSCIEQGIYDQASCEDYLNTTRVDLECRSEEIINREDCTNFLLEKYGASVACLLDDDDLCQSVLRDIYLNRLVIGQQQQEAIEEMANPLIGQTLTIAELNQELTDKGVDLGVLPLTSENARVFLAESQKETILEDEDNLTIINNAVMVIDTDGDGLADDLEEYYGTDINNPDTDGDGYPDGTEVNNGYNPLGEGVLEKERTALDEVMLSGGIIEQPKVKSDKIDKDFEVQDVANTEQGVELKGVAQPNTWITLFLYSDLPLVMTTQTDASGNWSYGIKESLTDGHHRVYVTINDDTGKVVKQSSPVSFLVKRAQAVTANNYFDATTTQDSVDSMLVYYMIGAALLVVLALAIIMLLHRSKRVEETIDPQDG